MGTDAEAANLTGVSRATAYRELKQLADWALLKKTGGGRGTRYTPPRRRNRMRSYSARAPHP
jgi:DeoR/GlpR family transcriptional regulator of sugar metabolism